MNQVFVSSKALAGEKLWESDVNGTIDVGVGAKHGGSEENRTPEHLFIAALLNCQIAGFVLIAEKSDLSYERIEGTGVAHVTDDAGIWRVSRCELDITLIGAIDREKAQMVLDKADERCIVKHSITSDVTIRYSFG